MLGPEVVISYCHLDTIWRDRLLTHLRPLEQEGRFSTWYDEKIPPGEDWEQAIKVALSNARVAVLMVTAEYLGSDFILQKEVPTILARKKDGLRVLPVLTKACVWRHIGWLSSMKILPIDDKPIASPDHDIDAQLSAIASEVLLALEDESTERSPKMVHPLADLEVATLETNVDMLLDGGGGITNLDGFVLNSGRFLKRYIEIKEQHGVHIGQVRFIVPSASAVRITYNKKKLEDKGKYLLDGIQNIKSKWEDLAKEGAIGRVEFRRIDCVPRNLCVIRDRDLVLAGLYDPYPIHPVGLTCDRSWFHSSSRDSRAVCRAYSEWFRAVWEDALPMR